jgi:hypothetical protein
MHTVSVQLVTVYAMLYVCNPQNLRCKTSRTFRNKKREYLKGKINELETNNKNKNIKEICTEA